MGSPTTSHGKQALMNRREIESQIAAGKALVIIDGMVIKADSWLKYHPGGDKAIKHMIGRDATDEVNALHSLEARRLMRAFQVGRIEGRWQNFVPPIQGGRFVSISQKKQDTIDGVESVSEQGMTSATTSEELSPLFVPPEQNSDSVTRRRHARTLSAGQSSATSLDSLDLGGSATTSALSHIDVHTKQEIELDLTKYPPLDSSTQDNIVFKYRQLYERVRSNGLFHCRYSAYLAEVCRYNFLFGMCMLFLRLGWYSTSAAFLGMFWHQLIFTAHDAGHMGITHNFAVDTVIGIFIADFLGGLSLGWWKRNHNVHHIVTNSPEHDPDIEHMPFFAISPRFLTSLRSTYYDRVMTYDPFAKVMIKYQHHLYYVVLLFGRFNLYRLSWEYLFLGQGPRKGPAWWHRWLEIAGQIFFWAWFGYGILCKSIPTAWDRFVFVMVSHMVTMPIHAQITLSHFAMSTANLGVNESFPQKMLRTTMDIDCPEWLDFFHGGLQFQAIHHLYPRMPRHNLRKAQTLVQQFCDEVHIPYALYGFADGNKEVIGRLGEVARQAKILAECQKTVANNPVPAH